MGITVIEEIRTHEKEVLAKLLPDDLRYCPHCKEIHTLFKQHDSRKRLFLVIVGSFVKIIRSFLGRWKCTLCGHTFTYYPDFAVPYKRYVKGNILILCEKYLGNDDATYRKVIEHDGSAIGYDSGTEKIDERQLVGSTVWRWLGFLGLLKECVRKSLDLIKQKDPSTKVFRQIHPVHYKKYRSEERKDVLNYAMRLLFVEEEFKKLFSVSIFPKFATGYL